MRKTEQKTQHRSRKQQMGNRIEMTHNTEFYVETLNGKTTGTEIFHYTREYTRENRLQHSSLRVHYPHTWFFVSGVSQLWRCSLTLSLSLGRVPLSKMHPEISCPCKRTFMAGFWWSITVDPFVDSAKLAVIVT